MYAIHKQEVTCMYSQDPLLLRRKTAMITNLALPSHLCIHEETCEIGARQFITYFILQRSWYKLFRQSK